MTEEIVIAETEGAERDELGQLVHGMAIEATEVGITAEYICLNTSDARWPADNISADWGDVIRYVPSIVLHAEIHRRLICRDLGGLTPEQAQLLPKKKNNP